MNYSDEILIRKYMRRYVMVSFRILCSLWPSLYTSNFVNGIDYVWLVTERDRLCGLVV
jgi:hypothetical protein